MLSAQDTPVRAEVSKTSSGYKVEFPAYLRHVWQVTKRDGTASAGFHKLDVLALESALREFATAVRVALASVPDPPSDGRLGAQEVKLLVEGLRPSKKSYRLVLTFCEYLRRLTSVQDGRNYALSDVVHDVFYSDGADLPILRRWWRYESWLRRQTEGGRRYTARYATKRKEMDANPERKAKEAQRKRAARLQAKAAKLAGKSSH